MERKYPTNREFRKTIRHNGHNYTLRSVFDTDNQYDFDNTYVNYDKTYHTYNFDNHLQKKSYKKLNRISDEVDNYINSILL